jgi:hypothetical protein
MSLPGILSKYIDAGASFDEKRIYRYALWRRWSTQGDLLLWVMLNPSTADEHVLDPTLRKVEGFSRRRGFGGFHIANVYAYRTPFPAVMFRGARQSALDIVGPDNDAQIIAAARVSASVVVGWGKNAKRDRVQQVAEVLRPFKPMCLGRNNDGSPVHPLYIPYEREFEPWSVR